MESLTAVGSAINIVQTVASFMFKHTAVGRKKKGLALIQEALEMFLENEKDIHINTRDLLLKEFERSVATLMRSPFLQLIGY